MPYPLPVSLLTVEGGWVQIEGPRLQPRATTASYIATSSNIVTTFDLHNGKEEEEEEGEEPGRFVCSPLTQTQWLQTRM